MSSFFSTFKHLAAFEAAKAAVMNGGGLSHSIKNIVMDNGTGGGGGGAGHGHMKYSPQEGSGEESPAAPNHNSNSLSSLSPGSNGGTAGGGGSKRRYSAPDNVFGDAEIPPKKYISH